MDATTRRQTFRFLISGIAATAADFVTYVSIVHLVFDGGEHDIAKGASYVVGTTVAFFLNKFWTFESTKRSLTEVASFLLLYALSAVLNIGANHLALAVLPAGAQAEVIAFLFATGCSTVSNFLGQKLWVFRSPDSASGAP